MQKAAMHRTSRFRTACRITAALFIVVAGARLLAATIPLLYPLLATAYVDCDPCMVRVDPVLLLEPGAEQRRAWQTPGAEQRILDLIEQPGVRMKLLAAEAVRALPYFMLFVSLAFALRSLASAGFNLGAVRWLRRAALAAVVWTISLPVSQSIRWTVFSPVTNGSDVIHVRVNLAELILPALLSAAVWICVWALEEALTMRKDLEDYI